MRQLSDQEVSDLGKTRFKFNTLPTPEMPSQVDTMSTQSRSTSSPFGQVQQSQTPPPGQSWWDKFQSGAKTFNSAVPNFITGQVKGAISTATSMGQMGSEALESGYNATIGKLTGKKAMEGGQLARDFKQTDYVKPTNLAQQIGFGTEQIGEALTPMGVEAGIAKGLQASKALSAAPKFVQGAARVVAPLAGEIAESAGKTALQTGDEQATKDAALWTSLLGGAGRVGSEIKSTLGKNVGSRIVNSLVKPNKSQFAYGKNPGKTLIEEGIVGNSFDDLERNIMTRRQEVGQLKQEALSKPEYSHVRLDVEDTLAPIDEALKEAQKAPRQNASLISRLQDAKSDILGEAVDASGNVTKTRKFNNLSAKETDQLKQDIGQMTKYTGNMSDDEKVNKALQGVYGNMRKKVEGAVPEVKKLNETYGGLLSAEQAVKNRAQVTERSNLMSLPGTQLASGGATTAALLTGNITTSALVGLGLAGAEKALKTPATATRLAKWFSTAAPAERQRLAKAMPTIYRTLTEQTGMSSQSSPQ